MVFIIAINKYEVTGIGKARNACVCVFHVCEGGRSISIAVGVGTFTNCSYIKEISLHMAYVIYFHANTISVTMNVVLQVC